MGSLRFEAPVVPRIRSTFVEPVTEAPIKSAIREAR
jgi:hypothetical protein